MAYQWVRRGDTNAFFGLMLDNLAVMLILFGAITSDRPIEEQLQQGGIVRFTPEFVLTRMIPGTALGVLIGDLIYTWMAFRLARRTGRHDVTAMPLGLDTPSTFGVAFLVLIPSLQQGWRLYQDHEQAMLFAWNVGLVALVLSGVFKLLCAPFGNAIRNLVPRAGLLGSLAAIALALIAFLPMLLDGIAAVPLIGMTALVVILITLVAHRELPGKIPGALAAVLVGLLIYLAGRALEPLGIPVAPRMQSEVEPVWQPDALISFYSLPASWWGPVFSEAFSKLPVVLPFALATVVGGIDCTESAAAAGDEYDTRAILLTEAASSVLAGLLGGVIQTTPYIGHPAYKKMGARAAYTLATALFVGAVGYFGGFQFLFAWLPKAAMFTILVFVGLEITAQSFHATRIQHYPSLALAILPALAYLCLTVLKSTFGPFAVPSGERELEVLQTLRCLANGFLISGLLWAAALAMILDGRLRAAAVYYLIAALCAFFGIIHSPLPDERIDLPWNVLTLFQPGEPLSAFAVVIQYQTPYHWATAYALMALILFMLGWLGSARLPLKVEEGMEVSPEAAHS